LIAVSDSPEKVLGKNLPREFVLKVTHGSGGVIGVAESAPLNSFLPFSLQGWARFEVHPDNFDPRVATSLIAHWLTLRYEWSKGRNPEFAYRGHRPKILVEELIKPPRGVALLEVKAFVFNGFVDFFQLQFGGVGNGKSLLYLDKEGNRLPIVFSDSEKEWPVMQETPPIAWLSKVITLSEKLADGLDFVRVDILTSGEEVYVGELNNYPTAGDFELRPKSYERDLGSSWNPRY
jgi:hypothetical protein